jgi:hypothetical protein
MHNFIFLSWIKIKVHSSAKDRVCQYTFIGFYLKAYKEEKGTLPTLGYTT